MTVSDLQGHLSYLVFTASVAVKPTIQVSDRKSEQSNEGCHV